MFTQFQFSILIAVTRWGVGVGGVGCGYGCDGVWFKGLSTFQMLPTPLHPYIVGIYVITVLITACYYRDGSHTIVSFQTVICFCEKMRSENILLVSCFVCFFSPRLPYIFFHLVINCFVILVLTFCTLHEIWNWWG